MAKKKADRVAKMVGEVEAIAKELRASIRNRAKRANIPAKLKRAAADLRKRAGAAATHVDKHVRQLRKDLKKGKKTKRTTRRPARRRTRRK